MSRIFRKSAEVYQRVPATQIAGSSPQAYPSNYPRSAALAGAPMTPLRTAKARLFAVPRMMAANAGWRSPWKIEQFKRHWSAIGRLRTQTISTSNTRSITKMPFWIIRNQGSGSAAGTTFKKAGSSSQTRSSLQSDKLSAAEICGSPNSHSPMTERPLMPSASWNFVTGWWPVKRNISPIVSSHHLLGHILQSG